MKNQTIVLILALFMGVTLAYDTPGLLRDRSMPRKWGLFQPSFERSRETSDKLERRKLPYKATTGITSEDDEDEPMFVAWNFCEETKKELEVWKLGSRVYKPITEKYQYMCKDKDELSEPENTVLIGNKRHQICNSAEDHTFCFTKTEYKIVAYRSGPFTRYKTFREFGTGCECGYEPVKKR